MSDGEDRGAPEGSEAGKPAGPPAAEKEHGRDSDERSELAEGSSEGADPVDGLSASSDVPDGSSAREQIRGSSLLLTGRGLSVGVKFAAQLLIVRYLATSDYGAWTYALSVVAFFQGLASLGMNRVVGRFLPIYLEEEAYGEFFGTIGLVLAGILTTCTVIIVGFRAFPEQIASLIGDSSETPLALLFIVIFLVPLEALDDFLTGICATFSRSTTIFVRRYVLSPGLRITVALALVLLEADVLLLAWGWMGALAVGVLYYAWTVVVILRRQGLLRHLRRDTLTVPVREVFGFTVPLMTSDVYGSVMSSAAPLLLGFFSGMDAVALFRVVVPAAALNLVVLQSFGLLYTPSASRLHARGDRDGIARVYWRIAIWVAVLSFPLFALSFTAAEPLTVFFYGGRYEASAAVLSFLVLGQFFHAALGFNGMTLKVVGKLRWLVGINLAGAALNVLFNLALVPSFGALGAGIATAGAYVAHNLMKQGALHHAVGIAFFDRSYARPYLAIAGAALVLIAVRLVAPENAPVTVGAAIASTVWVLYHGRGSLEVEEMFPELLRFRIARLALGP